MFPRLLLLFTVVPALELYVLLKVGAQIGAGNTFLLIIATGVVGAHYARAQGFRVVARLQESLRAGRPPGPELLDGALLLFGGALLITPGFLSDAVGLSLVIPATRDAWKRVVAEWLRRKVARGEITVWRR